MLGPCEVMARPSMLPVSPPLTTSQPFPLPTITLSVPHALSCTPSLGLIRPWPPGASAAIWPCVGESSESCQDFSFWDAATFLCLDFRSFTSLMYIDPESICRIVVGFSFVVV